MDPLTISMLAGAGLGAYGNLTNRDKIASGNKYQTALTRYRNKGQQGGRPIANHTMFGDMVAGAAKGAEFGKQIPSDFSMFGDSAAGLGGVGEAAIPGGEFSSMPMGGPVMDGQEVNFDNQMHPSDWDFLASLSTPVPAGRYDGITEMGTEQAVPWGPQMGGQPPQPVGQQWIPSGGMPQQTQQGDGGFWDSLLSGGANRNNSGGRF